MNFIKIDQVLPGTCLSVTLCADNYSIDSNKLLTLKDLKILKEAGYTYLFINGKFDEIYKTLYRTTVQGFIYECAKMFNGYTDDECIKKIFKWINESPFMEELLAVMYIYDRQSLIHSFNVGMFYYLIRNSTILKISKKDAFVTGILHDIGKCTVPLHILNKPGRLTDSEKIIMNSHVISSYNLVCEYYSEFISQIIFQHHERTDGSGYPQGISGRHISKEVTILQMLDTYDAIRSKRPYKVALDNEQAFRIVYASFRHDRQFDVLKKIKEIGMEAKIC